MWSVINEGHNQVRLHNHNNFLAIVNGQTTVIHVVSKSHFFKLTPRQFMNASIKMKERMKKWQLILTRLSINKT